MKHAEKIIREQTLTEAIRELHPLMGEEPSPESFAMLERLKDMREAATATVASSSPVDYLEQVQGKARRAHLVKHAVDKIGRAHSASASVDTPLGKLECMTWKRPWEGEKRARVTWASEYQLAGEFISVREIKAAGLAARPTTRNRQRRSADI